MRLVDKESEWHDTETGQKQGKNKKKNCASLNCKFNI